MKTKLEERLALGILIVILIGCAVIGQHQQNERQEDRIHWLSDQLEYTRSMLWEEMYEQ